LYKKYVLYIFAFIVLSAISKTHIYSHVAAHSNCNSSTMEMGKKAYVVPI
jgi:hypothetical protein